jgi:hypothetical protein
MIGMWTTKFWKDLGERAIASAAGGALAAMGIDAFGTAHDLNPTHILIGTGIAALVSVLKGIVASQKGDPSSASLVE